MKYKLAIFDMDGTILNTIDDLADCMNYSLRRQGLPERTLKEVTSFVGNGIRKLVERAVPEGTGEEVMDETHRIFLEYYKDHSALKTRPYDGINETIAKLRSLGVKTAVVSNKADFAVQDLCEDYFKDLFDFALGDKEGMARKPHPDGVNLVLETLGVKREDAVYIGDSEVDLQTANNAGLDVIMVGWGFREEDYILSLGAEFVIHTPEEIIERMR